MCCDILPREEAWRTIGSASHCGMFSVLLLDRAGDYARLTLWQCRAWECPDCRKYRAERWLGHMAAHWGDLSAIFVNRENAADMKEAARRRRQRQRRGANLLGVSRECSHRWIFADRDLSARSEKPYSRVSPASALELLRDNLTLGVTRVQACASWRMQHHDPRHYVIGPGRQSLLSEAYDSARVKARALGLDLASGEFAQLVRAEHEELRRNSARKRMT